MSTQHAFTTMADVEEQVTTRLCSGSPAINTVLGSSVRYNDRSEPVGSDSGYANGMVSLLAGESGVGKTKLYVDQCIKMTEDRGLTVLVFQKEMSLGQFKEIVMNNYRANGRVPSEDALKRFIVREERDHKVCCDLIEQIKPAIVIFDSYNMLKGSKTEDGIEDIIFDLKRALGNHTACVMLAHMNKEAKGVKGNNHVVYMSDAVFLMRWAENPETPEEQEHCDQMMAEKGINPFKGRFKMSCEKNRCGDKNNIAYLAHDKTRIVVLSDQKNDEPSEPLSLEIEAEAEKYVEEEQFMRLVDEDEPEVEEVEPDTEIDDFELETGPFAHLFGRMCA